MTQPYITHPRIMTPTIARVARAIRDETKRTGTPPAEWVVDEETLKRVRREHHERVPWGDPPSLNAQAYVYGVPLRVQETAS